LNANRVVSVDRLADDLYSGAAPVTAVTQVQRQISEETELGPVSSALAERRAALDVPTRTAAFTTREPAHDAIRLATRHDVELVLLDAPRGLDALPRRRS
jgi:hypothetical protein